MRDDALLTLLEGTEGTQGIGHARIVDVGDARVFAKSIPLTGAELARPNCTDNLFGLPGFYHYGIGSLGFGAYRELAVQKRASDWVLNGECELFPIVYHHRVLPIRGEAFEMSADELDEYIAYWDDSSAVRDYVLARRSATQHLVIFLEYIPHVLRDWLWECLDQAAMVFAGMKRALEFLHSKGIGHFDAHLGNVLTDGRQIFLTDFGLSLDSSWSLENDERLFFEAHRYYDDGVFARSLCLPLRQLIDQCDDRKKEALHARFGELTLSTTLDNIDSLSDSDCLSLPVVYREVLVRHRDAVKVLDRVFASLRSGSKSRGGYDDDELRRALPHA